MKKFMSALILLTSFVVYGSYVALPPEGGGGGGTWGSITGTLSSQTDLQSALNAKSGVVTANNTIYVDKSGNDTTCVVNRVDLPCLTVAKAVTLVTSPTSSNRFRISVGVGTFVESTLTLKPWTWFTGSSGMLMGGPSRISVSSNAITLDAAWANGSQRAGLANIYLTGSTGINFDRQALSGAGSSVLELFNVGMNGTLTFKANQGTLDFLDARNVRVFGGLAVSGGAIQIFDSEILSNITFNTSGTQNLDSDLFNLQVAGNLSVTSTGSNTAAVRIHNIYVDGTITPTGSGTTISTEDGAYIPSTPANWLSVPTTVEGGLNNLASQKQDKYVYSKLTTDQTHKESDGINAITDLNVAVAANVQYLITCFISYNSLAQGVIDINNNYPASFVFADYGSTGPNEVLATCQTRTPSNGTACLRFLNVTNNYPGSTTFYINFKNGANAGNVAFRWTSKSAGDADTTIFAGSFCRSEVIP